MDWEQETDIPNASHLWQESLRRTWVSVARRWKGIVLIGLLGAALAQLLTQQVLWCLAAGLLGTGLGVLWVVFKKWPYHHQRLLRRGW